MMTKLVNLTYKYSILGVFIRLVSYISLQMINIWYEITASLRKNKIGRSKYRELLDLEDKYKGKRCFLICTGPSLTIEDLEKLKDEYTFGMNSLCLWKEKSSFRPKFFGCCDLGVYRKLKYQIIDYCSNRTEIFVSDRLARQDTVDKNWHIVPLNVAYHAYSRWFKENFWCKFRPNAYVGVYDMHSVTHFLIQIAVYMGFTEIYLLGADTNQVLGKKVHFQDYGVPDTTIGTARERNICGYEEIKKHMNEYGFKVYNATRGGMLEVFERVDLDEIITN